MSSSVPPPPPGKEPPSIIQKLTLGQSVQLGELYDARTGSFLGTQMYDQKRISGAIATTTNTYSELSLSMSNTLQDKSSVLDLSAELSVSVLSGLIKVSGSASYFHDSKSNTQERTWVLSYKARLREERLCFTEPGLGLDVLPLVRDNYIRTQAATHFVSAITYGGNLFARMTAKESKLEEEQRIEGSLQASFEGLKGILDVSGKVSAKIEGKFKDLNEKFDVQIYGDVALPGVPLNPEDVPVTISEAANALMQPKDGSAGGVPMSVTLQPIPESLFGEKPLLERIDESRLNQLLDDYADLEDIHSRFSVVSEFAKANKNIVPNFARDVEQAVVEFRDSYRKRLEELAQAVKDLLQGKGPSGGSDPRLKDEVQKLTAFHTQLLLRQNDDEGKRLRDLEPFFFKFRALINGLSYVGYRLRSADEVSVGALTASSKIPLVLVPPIDNSGISLTKSLIRLSFLLRTEVPRYFPDPNGKEFDKNSCYVLYVVKDILEDWLPEDSGRINEPTIYSGLVTSGVLTWTRPLKRDLQSTVNLPRFLCHTLKYELYALFPLITLVSPKFFTLTFRFSAREIPPNTHYIITLDAGQWKNSINFFLFPNGLISASTAQWVINSSSAIVLNLDHWVTFVQNLDTRMGFLYFNAKLVGSTSIPDTWDFKIPTLSLSCNQNFAPQAVVSNVRAHAAALSQEEIASDIEDMKRSGVTNPSEDFVALEDVSQSGPPVAETPVEGLVSNEDVGVITSVNSGQNE